MNTKEEHLANCQIAGFTYYDGALVFNDLKIVTKLKLKLDAENKFDARAVAIYYKKHKVSYIPKAENKFFPQTLFSWFTRFCKSPHSKDFQR